jgi:hypothetical protein
MAMARTHAAVSHSHSIRRGRGIGRSWLALRPIMKFSSSSSMQESAKMNAPVNDYTRGTRK